MTAPKTPVTDAHREIATREMTEGIDECSQCLASADDIAQAIADAEARGREAGIRAAAEIPLNHTRRWNELSDVIGSDIHTEILALLKETEHETE